MTDRTENQRHQTLVLMARLLADLKLLEQLRPDHRAEIASCAVNLAALRAQIMAKG